MSLMQEDRSIVDSRRVCTDVEGFAFTFALIRELCYQVLQQSLRLVIASEVQQLYGARGDTFINRLQIAARARAVLTNTLTLCKTLFKAPLGHCVIK